MSSSKRRVGCGCAGRADAPQSLPDDIARCSIADHQGQSSCSGSGGRAKGGGGSGGSKSSSSSSDSGSISGPGSGPAAVAPQPTTSAGADGSAGGTGAVGGGGSGKKKKPTVWRACYNCGRSTRTIQRCSRCKFVGYCSVQCQSESWRGCGPALARNGSVPDPHRTWCVRPGPRGVDRRARELSDFVAALLDAGLLRTDDEAEMDHVETDFVETFESPDIRYAPAVYEAACERYGLHGGVVRALDEEASSLAPPWAKGEHLRPRPSFAHYFLNNCLSGMWVRCGPPSRSGSGGSGNCGSGSDGHLPSQQGGGQTRVFLRHGNSCADGRRVLALLRSDLDRAWPAWLRMVSAHVRYYYGHAETLSGRQIRSMPEYARQDTKAVPRDILVGTIYALVLDDVADVVLTHHAAETWSALGEMMRTVMSNEDRLDPNVVVEAYAYALTAVVREQAKKLKGREWADIHVPLSGVCVMERSKEMIMYATLARANALAYIEARGSITNDDLRPWMERCDERHIEEA